MDVKEFWDDEWIDWGPANETQINHARIGNIRD